MSRRNPMNERYGKHTAPGGKTRRSAASAKPKRAEATGVGKKTSASKKPSAFKGAQVKSSASNKRPIVIHPDTAEYRRWRRIWWVLLVLPLVITLVSYPLMRENRPLAYGMLGVAYACMAAALYIDFSKLRKIRQEWAERGGDSKKQGKNAEKPEKGSSD